MRYSDVLFIAVIICVAFMAASAGFNLGTPIIITEEELVQDLNELGEVGIINDTLYYLGSESISPTELSHLGMLSDKYVILVSTSLE